MKEESCFTKSIRILSYSSNKSSHDKLNCKFANCHHKESSHCNLHITTQHKFYFHTKSTEQGKKEGKLLGTNSWIQTSEINQFLQSWYSLLAKRLQPCKTTTTEGKWTKSNLIMLSSNKEQKTVKRRQRLQNKNCLTTNLCNCQNKLKAGKTGELNKGLLSFIRHV